MPDLHVGAEGCCGSAVPPLQHVPALLTRISAKACTADAMLARKRVDVQAALGKTLHMRRTLRVWVYTTSGGQPRQTPEAREEPRIALEAAAREVIAREAARYSELAHAFGVLADSVGGVLNG